LEINTTVGFEVSNDIRVGIQVELLGRRHVDRHHGVIGNLLAPLTNGGETRAVVRPSGCPLHVAIVVRTRVVDWSRVVANTNKRPARHSCTQGHRRNGENEIHNRVEVDEKENGRHGVGDECDGEEENTVAE